MIDGLDAPPAETPEEYRSRRSRRISIGEVEDAISELIALSERKCLTASSVLCRLLMIAERISK